MMNIKYYVLLMVGIFLAMGLGMMIGITLENQNILQNQQIEMVRQIEDRFVSLRTETDQLQEGLRSLEVQKDQLNELSSTLLTEVVRNKLSGLHVALVSFTGQTQSKELLDFLQLTGASVRSDISFFPSVEGDRAASSVQSPDEMISAVIDDLVYSMNYGGVTPLLREAEELKLLSNAGGYEFPIDRIILIGQGNATLSYDKLLIRRAGEAGIPIVAVESGDLEDSAIAEYKAVGISTVDHVESLYGKAALASVLSGNQGNFGLESNSQELLPCPLFPEDGYTESVAANGENTQ